MPKKSKPYMPFEDLRYCGAKTRTTQQPCKGSAMANGRCRLHGGLSTGRPITTGQWTKQAIQQRREVSQIIRQMKVMSAAWPPEHECGL